MVYVYGLELMTDLLLNPCGDLDITEGRLSIVSGADAVRQRWLIYVRTFLGEWFLDQSIGVPYFQRLLKKRVTRTDVKEIFSRATLEVPGIRQVVSVVVDDLDAAARHVEISVNCIISTDEGDETAQFKYTGTLPPGGCEDPATAGVPFTIEDLEIWFDAQDAASYTQTPTLLTMQNKAGAGSATPAASETEPQIIGNQINGHPALVLDRTDGQHLQMTGIPALRATTGYDGSFTVFAVTRLDTGQAGPERGVWALDGVQGDGSTREWYGGYQLMSPTPYVGDEAGLGLRSEEVGTPEASPYEDASGGGLADDAPTIRVWSRDFTITPDAGRKLGLNDVTLDDSVATTPPALRQLNGEGLLGAAYRNSDGNPELYFDGAFGEYIVYSRALTDAEIQTMVEYLQVKWGIPDL
jgi:hypothetical protein